MKLLHWERTCARLFTVNRFCYFLTRDFFKKPSCRKHEWEKHGTCAAQLDVLNSQKKYFGKSLDLYKELSLNR